MISRINTSVIKAEDENKVLIWACGPLSVHRRYRVNSPFNFCFTKTVFDKFNRMAFRRGKL